MIFIQGYKWNNKTCTCEPNNNNNKNNNIHCPHGRVAACKGHVRVEVFLFCLVAEMLGLLVIGFCYRGYIAQGRAPFFCNINALLSNSDPFLNKIWFCFNPGNISQMILNFIISEMGLFIWPNLSLLWLTKVLIKTKCVRLQFCFVKFLNFLKIKIKIKKRTNSICNHQRIYVR